MVLAFWDLQATRMLEFEKHSLGALLPKLLRIINKWPARLLPYAHLRVSLGERVPIEWGFWATAPSTSPNGDGCVWCVCVCARARALALPGALGAPKMCRAGSCLGLL